MPLYLDNDYNYESNLNMFKHVMAENPKGAFSNNNDDSLDVIEESVDFDNDHMFGCQMDRQAFLELKDKKTV